MEKRLTAAIEVIKDAGNFARDAQKKLTSSQISYKAHQDYATEIDRQVEVLMRRELLLAFPQDAFVGEEYGESSKGEGGTWVADPIDGTACYVAGLPSWCISLAWVRREEIEIGVVYAPETDELFSAHRGGGARLNGQTLMMDDSMELGQGFVSLTTSFQLSTDRMTTCYDRLLRLGALHYDCGSAALALCYLAAGRLVGFVDPWAKSWDLFAGYIIVREAGGQFDDSAPLSELLVQRNAVAGCPHVLPALRSVLEGVGPENSSQLI